MTNRVWRSALALSCGFAAVAAQAGDHFHYAPARGAKPPLPIKSSLTNHGGPVIVNPKVVFIFWGPSFGNVASPDYAYARSLQSFRNQLGTTPEFNVITQYSGIQLAFLGAGAPDWFDGTTPPTNVTDAAVRTVVNQYLSIYPYNASAIYEVVLPSTSYSSTSILSHSCWTSGIATYCAYHDDFTSGSSVVKYAVQPYPSCSRCQNPDWTAAQNMEHFVAHETREATTDPQGNAWYDSSSGDEADDKCNWTPAPFLGTGGYGYQWEWSNASGSCVQSLPVTGAPPPGNPFLYASAADERQACYGLASRNSSYCGSIGDFNDKQMCSALAQSSQTPCAQITDRNLQLSCYGIAVKPNIPSNCHDITDLDMRQFCYGAAGVANTDLGQCPTISARNTQLLCYAMNDFISSNCSDITNANDRQFCFGVSGHDTSFCAGIL